MDCKICSNGFEDKLLYENDKIKIMLAIDPATSGHIQIFSKQHYTILEEIPEDLMKYMSSSANKISMLLFEGMKVHGTNIIIQNGTSAGQTIPHFSIHIIPRRTDDNMNIDWELKRAKEEDLESIKNILESGKKSGDEPVKPPEPKIEEPEPVEVITAEPEASGVKKKNNYLQHFERIP